MVPDYLFPRGVALKEYWKSGSPSRHDRVKSRKWGASYEKSAKLNIDRLKYTLFGWALEPENPAQAVGRLLNRRVVRGMFSLRASKKGGISKVV